jgi:NADPH-dependent glutamate synthase beta subunit-like oxidoreductase
MSVAFDWRMPVQLRFGSGCTRGLASELGNRPVLVLAFEPAAALGLQAAWTHALGSQLQAWIPVPEGLSTLSLARALAARVWPLLAAQPDAVLLNEHGQVRGMRFARTRVENGRLQSTGQTFELAADAIFSAIGQAFDAQALSDPLASELKREGERIWVDAQQQTSVPGIYAGGDCTALGQDLTVQAVQHGKLAAEAIHSHLMLNVEAA